MNLVDQLTKEFNLKKFQVVNTLQLIDEGNTIPFIARYRKEKTGELSDVVLRELNDRLQYLRNLEARKEEVIRLIEEQGKLTVELKKEITVSETLQRVEDLYRPYKQKKSTRASKAKEKGLDPLADIIHNQEMIDGSIEEIASTYIDAEKGVKNSKEALKGAMDIIAERISDNPEFRKKIRDIIFKEGLIIVNAVKKEEKSVYEMYYDYKELVRNISNHRILAVNRGEKEKFLKVKIQSPDDKILNYVKSNVIVNEEAVTTKYLIDSIEDGYKRLLLPSVERDIRGSLTERAETEAIKVFAKNLKPLLMQAPVKTSVVMGFDPAYRTGCKIAVVDATGKLVDYTTVYPTKPQNKVEEAKKTLKKLIQKHDIDIIAIGNGTASRESEMFVSDMLKEIDKTVYYTIVSEAGASVYSASKLANEEYPDINVSIRGAISIARRLQDPLAELVKIDPKSIGVGQYQHDLNQKNLSEALTNVVEDCVNNVGVDLNTASVSLLKYISGINASIAKNVVAYREEHGKFNNREELLKVKRLGAKAYEQAAGFLRILDGENILDNTSVHPESYDITNELMQKLNYFKDDITNKKLSDIEQRVLDIDIKEEVIEQTTQDTIKDLSQLKALMKAKTKPVESKTIRMNKRLKVLSDELKVGIPTLKDVIKEITKPGRDPREDMPKPIFRSDVLKMEDLQIGMIMTGTVRNVVDFGAFVDIGVKQDGLVHISELSKKFVKNPMTVVSVGDEVKVKIIDLDLERKKVSLSIKQA
ncbi:Tex family protein [Abyssisolibacter fermentans]|uniref:Tex family protein n=1 Tax=Abyssisolibacter fermentans TaxID=1766203 RepID=UPI000829BB9C|nr:Tex family protein [Abyssisolibacter fermentans]